MLLLCVMGVRGYSRSVSAVHSGMTKRVRFSYKANNRSNFAGVFPSVSTLALVLSADFSYAAIVFEFRCLTSKT